jgi:hypothetical protein
LSGISDYVTSLVPRATGYVTSLVPTATADATRSGGGSVCQYWCSGYVWYCGGTHEGFMRWCPTGSGGRTDIIGCC